MGRGEKKREESVPVRETAGLLVEEGKRSRKRMVENEDKSRRPVERRQEKRDQESKAEKRACKQGGCKLQSQKYTEHKLR